LKYCCSVRCLFRCGLCSCLLMEAARSSETSVYLPYYAASRLGIRLPSSNIYHEVIPLGRVTTFYSSNTVNSTGILRVTIIESLLAICYPADFLRSSNQKKFQSSLNRPQEKRYPFTIIYISPLM
jgi:hypothetical protein